MFAKTHAREASFFGADGPRQLRFSPQLKHRKTDRDLSNSAFAELPRNLSLCYHAVGKRLKMDENKIRIIIEDESAQKETPAPTGPPAPPTAPYDLGQPPPAAPIPPVPPAGPAGALTQPLPELWSAPTTPLVPPRPEGPAFPALIPAMESMFERLFERIGPGRPAPQGQPAQSLSQQMPFRPPDSPMPRIDQMTGPSAQVFVKGAPEVTLPTIAVKNARIDMPPPQQITAPPPIVTGASPVTMPGPAIRPGTPPPMPNVGDVSSTPLPPSPARRIMDPWRPFGGEQEATEYHVLKNALGTLSGQQQARLTELESKLSMLRGQPPTPPSVPGAIRPGQPPPAQIPPIQSATGPRSGQAPSVPPIPLITSKTDTSGGKPPPLSSGGKTSQAPTIPMITGRSDPSGTPPSVSVWPVPLPVEIKGPFPLKVALRDTSQLGTSEDMGKQDKEMSVGGKKRQEEGLIEMTTRRLRDGFDRVAESFGTKTKEGKTPLTEGEKAATRIATYFVGAMAQVKALEKISDQIAKEIQYRGIMESGMIRGDLMGMQVAMLEKNIEERGMVKLFGPHVGALLKDSPLGHFLGPALTAQDKYRAADLKTTLQKERDMTAKVHDIGRYSPDVAMAQAQGRAMEIGTRIFEAEMSGPELAKSWEAKTRFDMAQAKAFVEQNKQTYRKQAEDYDRKREALNVVTVLHQVGKHAEATAEFTKVMSGDLSGIKKLTKEELEALKRLTKEQEQEGKIDWLKQMMESPKNVHREPPRDPLRQIFVGGIPDEPVLDDGYEH